MNGVSIIIPAYNAEKTMAECLQAATNLKWSGDLEIIVIDDGSSDRTAEIASSFPQVKVVTVPNGGAARATNIGVETAQHDIIISLDSDAIIEEDWLEKAMPAFDDPAVGAVGGYCVTANRSIVGRLMGYDMEFRLDQVPEYTDHLYTMNTAYRRQTLAEVGMFDEEMRIAYDADISRRISAGGYRLVLKKDARCRHYWRDDLKGYLKQQHDYAYYRLNVARKFKRPHDRQAGLGMILQTPFTILVLLAAVLLGVLLSPFGLLALVLLPLVHLPRTIAILIKKREACILLLPFFFTLRNLAWTLGAIRWEIREVLLASRRRTKAA